MGQCDSFRLLASLFIGHIIMIIIGIEGVGEGGGGWLGKVAPGQEEAGDCLQVPTTRIHGETDDGENHQNNHNNPI